MILSLLIKFIDNWLHTTTTRMPVRYYGSVQTLLGDLGPPFNESAISAKPSFKPTNSCDATLKSTLPQNISSAPPPCSLNETQGVTNIRQPEVAYSILDQGISQINSSFNLMGSVEIDDPQNPTPYIVTVFQNSTYHSILFNLDSAIEGDYNFGIDYVANTTSMTTQCTVATKECNITATNSGSRNLDQNDLVIPYDCYNQFSGNLGQTPTTGHERAQGWNMSFYELSNGSPQNILVQSQSNPFNFYVVAAVNSIDSSDIDTDIGALVDVGGGFSAFALNCAATIYDVRFSLVNGSFSLFSPTRATPQMASIIKAPLQVGFGQYHLYEAAQIAALLGGDSIADIMSMAFSQTGMALASGSFDFDDYEAARVRNTIYPTKVGKAPFWFLVVVCLLYSGFGIVMTIVAFVLRRSPEIRDQQTRLIDEWGPEIENTGPLSHEEREKRERARERERDSTNSLNSASLASN